MPVRDQEDILLAFLPQFDELYVLSDLHMGGQRSGAHNFQIFNRDRRLGNLIRQLRETRPSDQVGLVVNGDIIDSLAEESVSGYVALETGTALAMIDRICSDPAFSPVWEALSAFVRTPQCYLVFVLGNHDIELALPPVEARLRRRLAEGDIEAQSRLVFATHGGGFACTVAGARVFCTHGNEVDDWNLVDYNALGQLSNAMSAGRGVDARGWVPNAGTRLVIDLMNPIKRRHPFVDLLKPEIEPVLGILLTIEPSLLRRMDLASVFPILRSKLRGGLVTRNLLSAETGDISKVSAEQVAVEATERLLGSRLRTAVHERRSEVGRTEDELLLAAGEAVANGTTASDLLAREDQEGTLGWSDIFFRWISGVPPEEALRRALQDWLKDDTTYAVDTQDSTFSAIIDRVGPEVDYVITGHTHLARAIEFGPKRYYYNSGTWIRLLRLTSEALAEPDKFKGTAYAALVSGRMQDLDDCTIPGPGGEMVPLVYDRTNLVRISAQADQVVGELLRVTDKDQKSVTLSVEPDTRQFIV